MILHKETVIDIFSATYYHVYWTGEHWSWFEDGFIAASNQMVRLQDKEQAIGQ